MTDSVTVLVPTVGRSQGLRRVLAALAVQHDPGIAWDVLVVDNAAEPTAATSAPDLAVPLRVIHEPRRGAAHARNAGIGAVTAAIVAMLDDDVVPADDWLARIVAPIVAGQRRAVGGRVVLDPTVARPRWLDDDLAGYLTQLDLGPEERSLRAGEYLLTANAAFATEVLAAVGLDPRLGPRPEAHLTNDDLDLTRRLQDTGVVIGWVPDAVVVHDAPAERLRLTWLIRRCYQQGRSDWLLDRDRYLTSRLGGLRVGWRRLLAGWRWRVDHVRGAALPVHLAADAARAFGFWREAAAGVRRRGRR